MNKARLKCALICLATVMLHACSETDEESENEWSCGMTLLCGMTADQTQQICRQAFSCGESAPLGAEELAQSNWNNVYDDIESEPNHPIGNAQQWASFSSIMSPTFSLIKSGAVNDISDPADYVNFPVHSNMTIVAYLCDTPNNCRFPYNGNDETFKGDEIFIELLDATGDLIDTTFTASAPQGHTITFNAQKDRRYYVVVKAADTGGVNFYYRLVISD